MGPTWRFIRYNIQKKPMNMGFGGRVQGPGCEVLESRVVTVGNSHLLRRVGARSMHNMGDS